MNQYAPFFAALKAAEKRTGQTIDRAELIHNFTKGRTSSLKGLSRLQLSEITRQLGGDYPDATDVMRKKVISCLKYQGYTLPSGKADMNRIYTFIIKYGYLHKDLNDYTKEELPKLVYQAEVMKKKYIAKL